MGVERTEATPRRLVLLAHNHEVFGGAERCLDELVHGIRSVRPNTEVHVIVSREGELSARYPGVGISVHVIPHERWADLTEFSPRRKLARPARNARAIAHTVALLRRLRPAAALTNTLTVPVLAAAARLAGVRHAWLVHELGEELHFARGYERTLRRMGELSDVVVCNSEMVRDALAPLLGDVATQVVYPGVDVPTALPATVLRGVEPMRAVMVGHMSEVKGQRLAVRAVARARELGADVTLRIVGHCAPPFEQALRADVAQLGVEEHVSWTAQAADPWAAYTSSHVALVCSKREPFGRVTVEAQKCGLAVCASRSGGTPEIVVHGETGLLHEFGDTDALARDLVRLAGDERLRRRLARQARASATERFNVSAYAEQILGLVA
jgi:glycosyltransferase involved in cell wall biosynthesis